AINAIDANAGATISKMLQESKKSQAETANYNSQVDERKQKEDEAARQRQISRVRNFGTLSPDNQAKSYGMIRPDLQALGGAEVPEDVSQFEQQMGAPMSAYLQTLTGPPEAPKTFGNAFTNEKGELVQPTTQNGQVGQVNLGTPGLNAKD